MSSFMEWIIQHERVSKLDEPSPSQVNSYFHLMHSMLILNSSHGWVDSSWIRSSSESYTWDSISNERDRIREEIKVIPVIFFIIRKVQNISFTLQCYFPTINHANKENLIKIKKSMSFPNIGINLIQNTTIRISF